MARNKFDVDEELEEKYRKGSLTRALGYAKPYAWKMVLVLFIACIASLLSLLGPTLIQRAIDIAMPSRDMGLLIRLSLILLAYHHLHPVRRPAGHHHGQRGPVLCV